MTKPSLPKTATLQRFDVAQTNWPDNLLAWRLQLPRELYFAMKHLREALEKLSPNDAIGYPTRLLNNALMATTSLVHGFEYEASLSTSYALAITTQAGERPVDPSMIYQAINTWIRWWINKHAKIQRDKWGLLNRWSRDQAEPVDWRWEAFTPSDVIAGLDQPLEWNRRALPSLVAAMLHGKESTLNTWDDKGERREKVVQWRKVQDGGSQQLSLVGMVNHRPIFAPYIIPPKFKTQKPNTGNGFFAYKVNLRMVPHAGRAVPWLFISTHVQRYAEQSLKFHNPGRRASLLLGANRFRIDKSPTNATLIRLPIQYTKSGWQWGNDLPELLEKIGVEKLDLPDEIVTGNPRDWWYSAENPDRDSYYLIHAEGYKYEGSKGHSLQSGLSMTDSAEIISAIRQHVPILLPDAELQPDTEQIPPESKRPPMLRFYNDWPNETGKGKQPKDPVKRREFQTLLTTAIARATAEQPVHILICTHDVGTRHGIEIALREAMMLNEGEPLPPQITLQYCPIIDSKLLSALRKEARRADHFARLAEWQTFIDAQTLPADSAVFAMIEVEPDRKTERAQLGSHSVIRHAFAVNKIATQTIQTLKMKQTDQGMWVYSGRAETRHRANSAARDLLMRHTGALFGDLQTIADLAKLPQAVDVVAFYLHKSNAGIQFPVAAKLTVAGELYVRFPTQREWLRYSLAGPVLGQLFAENWSHAKLTQQGLTLKKASSLYLQPEQLSAFVQQTLKKLSHPTIALIEADNWRDRRGRRAIWPQLHSANLGAKLDELDFRPHGSRFGRTVSSFNNLHAVIRIRTGLDTPPYITDTKRDFKHPRGFYCESDRVPHYYSIGQRLATAREQRTTVLREAASMLEDKAPGIPIKHPQAVEFVPFYIHPIYATPLQQRALCRVPHLLRHATYWSQGNLVLPWPLHLAKKLLEDQLTILTLDD